MGGFAMAMAGALAGVGKGMATKGALDLEQRYKEALENLRSTNNRQDSTVVADLNDRNAARDDERGLDSAKTLKRMDQTFALDIAGAQAIAGQKAKESDQEFQLRKLRLESLLANNAEAAKAAREAAEQGKKVQDSFTNERTGDVTLLYGDGTTKVLSGAAPKLPRAETGTGSLLQPGGGISGQAVGNRPSLDSFQY